MSIYRVATPPVPAGGGSDAHVVHQRFAPSEGAAKKLRRELAEGNALKLGEVEYEAIDLKPGKAGFIEYMNAFQAMQPPGYEPAGYQKAAAKPKAKAKKAKK